jgi:hypothetical protein
MLDYLKENKLLAGISILVILGVGGYFAYNAGGDPALLTSTETASATSEVSRELLSTLSDLRTISLDESVFSDPAFVSLVDFRVAIPLEPIGRENPFAPLIDGIRTGPGATRAPTIGE